MSDFKKLEKITIDFCDNFCRYSSECEEYNAKCPNVELYKLVDGLIEDKRLHPCARCKKNGTEKCKKEECKPLKDWTRHVLKKKK